MKLLTKLKSALPFQFKKKKVAASLNVPNSDEKFYHQVLQSLKKDQKPLNIQFVNHAHEYISMILDVNYETKTLVIDEMNSPMGHKLAINHVPFIASSKHQGVSVIFASTVVDYGTADGVYFYRLRYPDKIDYLQRRTMPRIVPPADLAFYVEFMMPGYGHLRAKIEDFSIAGLQFSLPRNVKGAFSNIEKMDNLRLISPYLPPKGFSFAIKHCRFDAAKQKTYVGGQFIHLDNVGLKFLSSIVLRLKQTT